MWVSVRTPLQEKVWLWMWGNVGLVSSAKYPSQEGVLPCDSDCIYDS